MIDGITLNYQINDYQAWKKAVNPSMFLVLEVKPAK